MSKADKAKNILNEYISRQCAVRNHRLPSERELAQDLGFSRSTIGKALGVLEGEGVIVRKIGAGTFIAKPKEQKNFTVALVMRNAYHYTDSHFRLIVEKVSEYAEKQNIYVQIFDRMTDMFQESPDDNRLLKAIRSGVVDGVLITSRMPLSIISKINSLCPTVSINNIFGDGVEVPCISCDYFRAGFLSGKYLLENGHRQVAYVTENLDNPESTFEFSGFKSALEIGGVTLNTDNILETKLNLELFNQNIKSFFSEAKYTACFVRSSSHANTLVTVLQALNIRVPEDLSVIATGNYRNERQTLMKLTTIDNRLAEMCELGLKILGAKYNQSRVLFHGLTLLEPCLIEHDSVTNLNQMELINNNRF